MFNYRVIYSEEDQEFIGLCDQFPRLSWLETSAEKALQGIETLVTEVVNDMRSNNEPFVTDQTK